MYTHMKTTIEIADPLLEDARRMAAEEKTTVRALVEEGLRRVLRERAAARKHGFRLRDASFGGSGLQAGVADGSWERIRGLIYDGRGA
jgi:Arc/MetJ family transcription regulator